MATAPLAVAVTEPNPQPPRRWKRAKDGEHQFSTDSSIPTTSSDPAAADSGNKNPILKRSFRDTVTGKPSSDVATDTNGAPMDDNTLEYTEDMFDGRIVVEEKKIGKYDCPVFNLSRWEEARIQKPWRKGLIVNLLGRKIGYKALESRLNQLWVSVGSMNIIDLGQDFFLVTFTSEQDREFALGQGPWMIYDHYLTVRKWCPNFQPERANLDKLAVWVRFSGLPIEYYDPAFLHFVGNRIGRTIKVDKTTMQHERGKYARLCVEVDLDKPLRAVFEVKDKVYKIEYEGLHMLCLKCGKYGHYKEACPIVVEQKDNNSETSKTQVEMQENESMWSVVQKPRINPKKKQIPPKIDGNKLKGKAGGSRFNVFNSELYNEDDNSNNNDGSEKVQAGSVMQSVGNLIEKKTMISGGIGKKVVSEALQDPMEGVCVNKENNTLPSKNETEPEKIQEHGNAMDWDNNGSSPYVMEFGKGNIKAKVQRGTQVVRYEDWATVDGSGEVQIHTEEASTSENPVSAKCMTNLTHGSVDCPSRHPPRPPDEDSSSGDHDTLTQQPATQKVIDVVDNMVEDKKDDSHVIGVELGSQSNLGESNLGQ